MLQINIIFYNEDDGAVEPDEGKLIMNEIGKESLINNDNIDWDQV